MEKNRQLLIITKIIDSVFYLLLGMSIGYFIESISLKADTISYSIIFNNAFIVKTCMVLYFLTIVITMKLLLHQRKRLMSLILYLYYLAREKEAMNLRLSESEIKEYKILKDTYRFQLKYGEQINN